MTDGARIEHLHIENAFFFLDNAHESTFKELFDYVREQHDAGAITIIGEDGLPIPEEPAEQDDTSTPEEDEADETDEARAEEYPVTARARALHEVAEHVARARNLEGQKRSYKHPPSKHEELQDRYDNAVGAAGQALEGACMLCEIEDCALRDNPKRWIDTHAYADKADRRKGSSEVETVEARNKFLKVLDAGVEAGEQIHCDPAERD